MKRQPNLFIVGAPKCGTTSLAYWLAQRNDVFLCNPKEPNYFSFDLAKKYQRSLSEYESLFAFATDETVICDASTRYLSSAAALNQALAYNPDAKFVAVVRNPVDMFFSLHNHLFQVGIESLESAYDAWHAQWDRAQRNDFWRKNPEPDSLMYASICSLGSQLTRFLSIIPPAQQMVLFFDDLVRDPQLTYSAVIQFLGLDYRSVDLLPQNQRFKARSRLVTKCVRSAASLKRWIGVNRDLGLLNNVMSANIKAAEKNPVSIEFRSELLNYFGPEIDKLSAVTGRDLCEWKT